MNSIRAYSADVTAICKHCGSDLHSDFVASPDKRFIERAFEAMKRNARELFPSKDVEIQACLTSDIGNP